MSSRRLDYTGISEKADGRFQTNVRYVEDGIRKRATITAKTKREVAEKRKALLSRLDQGKPAKDRKVTLEPEHQVDVRHRGPDPHLSGPSSVL